MSDTNSPAGLFHVLTRRYIRGDDDTMSQLHDSTESAAMSQDQAESYRAACLHDLEEFGGSGDFREEVTVEPVQCWDCPNQAVIQAATGDFCAEHTPETADQAPLDAPDAPPVLRVRIHPAHDLFMRGIRYATVAGADIDQVTICQDGTDATFRVQNEYILPVDENWGALTWQIVVPPHGAVDETFAPNYLDALAFARSVHGATAVIRLTGWESN